MGEKVKAKKKGRLQMEKRAGIGIMIAGALILVMNFALDLEGFQQGLLSGGGAAMFMVGICKIIRAHRMSKNQDKAAEYEAQASDERAYYIAGVAARWTVFIFAYAAIVMGIIFAFTVDNEVLSQAFFYAACFELVLYSVAVMICNKKY